MSPEEYEKLVAHTAEYAGASGLLYQKTDLEKLEGRGLWNTFRALDIALISTSWELRVLTGDPAGEVSRFGKIFLEGIELHAKREAEGAAK